MICSPTEKFGLWAREDPRKNQGQLKRGHVAIAFDGVDALPRNSRGLGQLFLRPAKGNSQLFNPVCDGLRHGK